MPSLVRYEGAKVQAGILQKFEQNLRDSGHFQDLVCDQIACKVVCSIDEYLNLLSTLRKLPLQTKELLFKELRNKLNNFGENIQLSFLAAVHIAKKISKS